jgi:hypothetical protein
VCGPPCKTFVEIAGISTVYGIPATLTSESRTSAERTGTNRVT